MTTPTRSAKKSGSWLWDNMMTLIIDYYPEVQFRPYGSTATRENHVAFLRELKLGYVCAYAKGHSGYTTFPSSLGTQHNMLAKDMGRFLRDVTREAGTRLVFYYSGLTDGIAGLRHPEWRMKNPDGTDKELFTDFKILMAYGNCPLSGYFDEWVSVHLRELIENYDPDGIWVDGDWPGPCYCERCQARFRKETGLRQPWSEIRVRPDFDALYRPVWNRIEAEWRQRFNAFVKKLKPSCVYSAGNVSPRREFLGPFDWRSGDFFSPGFFMLHDMARMMRWYDTLDVPYDAYVCDTSFTHARKDVRSRSKTYERMLQESVTVAANGGGVGYWTYPTATGALVPSRMRKAIAVRRYLAEREDLFLHTERVRWTGIVVTDPSTPTFGGQAVEGAHKALAALHRSPALMDETGLDAPGARCDLLVLPEQARCAPAVARKLAAFVKAGGRLLTTGASIRSPEIQQLLGVAPDGTIQDGHVILKTGDEPTGIDRPWDRLKLKDAKTLYPLYLSWDSLNPECRNMPNNWPMHGQMDEEHPEPAGAPAATIRKLGRGVAVHVPTEFFAYYLRLGDPQLLRWLRELLGILDPQPFFRTTVPGWVDVSLRRKGGRMLVHFVNQNPGRDICRLHTDDTWVDEIPEVGPHTVEFRLPRAPKRVTLEPSGRAVPHHFARGVLTITLPRWHIHTCLAVRE